MVEVRRIEALIRYHENLHYYASLMNEPANIVLQQETCEALQEFKVIKEEIERTKAGGKDASSG